MADQEPAPDSQKKKLRHLGIAFKKGLTKSEASRLLDAAEEADPQREEAYQTAKDRKEDAELLGEIVNDEDAREMGDYKRLTQAQALQLRDYFVAQGVNWGTVDSAQMAGIIRHLFPDRIKQTGGQHAASAGRQKAKGCLWLLAAPAFAWIATKILRG